MIVCLINFIHEIFICLWSAYYILQCPHLSSTNKNFLIIVLRGERARLQETLRAGQCVQWQLWHHLYSLPSCVLSIRPRSYLDTRMMQMSASSNLVFLTWKHSSDLLPSLRCHWNHPVLKHIFCLLKRNLILDCLALSCHSECIRSIQHFSILKHVSIHTEEDRDRKNPWLRIRLRFFNLLIGSKVYAFCRNCTPSIPKVDCSLIWWYAVVSANAGKPQLPISPVVTKGQ